MYEELSAKDLLNALVNDHYEKAFHAKEQGRPVGWVSSNFPQEFIEVFDIDVVYPENQTAAISAKHESEEMINIAEGYGYSSDICGYARVNLGFFNKGHSEAMNMPMPDFILCCNNICNQLIKWFENIAFELKIPMFLLDIPFNVNYEITEERLEYMRSQTVDLIHFLEGISGKEYDSARMKEVMRISNETAKQWRRLEALSQRTPTAVNGFHLFNYMALMVCARGKESTTECIRKYADEIEKRGEEGGSFFKGEQKYRLMMEGIACWPYLRHNAKYLESKGMNITGSIYTQTWGRMYNNLDEMLISYSNVPDCINLERAVDRRKTIAEQANVDGMMVHMNRSCKIWDGFLLEMMRRVSNDLELPYITFDGDQSDPRVFNETQFELRIDTLDELLEEGRNSDGI
ncbi:MAG: 2-hydroxyacyl-CoA dehydratase family protein [Tissierellia bacterium]|nr:2-hydroxyacyl-CoA dehydratase family protein [Tissierellia bacterium]